MTVHVHRSTEVDPFARGRSLGHDLREPLHRAVAGYAAIFAAFGARPDQVREWGERALAETAAWAPALAAEIEGIAAGAGLARWQLGALNGRTEVLAAVRSTGEGECSTSVTLTGDGAPRTVQTWDWHDTLRDGMLLWTLPGGVRTFTEVGIVGKIGVNDAGLGVHFNVLRHASDDAEIGVPVHVVARRILDEATTIDEATDLARSARVSASTLITVVTADGVRGLELSPARVGIVDAEPGGSYLHANHFLDPGLVEGERSVAPESTTYERLGWLRTHRAGLAATGRTERARGLCVHRTDGAPVCAHADPAAAPHARWETLATISLDVTAGEIAVHEGGPCTVSDATWQTLTAPTRAARP